MTQVRDLSSDGVRGDDGYRSRRCDCVEWNPRRLSSHSQYSSRTRLGQVYNSGTARYRNSSGRQHDVFAQTSSGLARCSSSSRCGRAGQYTVQSSLCSRSRSYSTVEVKPVEASRSNQFVECNIIIWYRSE